MLQISIQTVCRKSDTVVAHEERYVTELEYLIIKRAFEVLAEEADDDKEVDVVVLNSDIH